MSENYTQTVAAVSTPHGRGGIAMIRISGPDSAEIIDRVFVPAGKASPADAPRRAVYGRIVSGKTTVDSGICTFFAAPASYTGEDMAEITCHGGVYVTSAVLEAVFAAGARPAAAGEFTRRAFISGKLTLSEAEAVGMLIDADTAERASLASSAERGLLSAAVTEAADMISGALSQLYAAIDYPDEDIGEISESDLADIFDSAGEKLKALSATYRRGSAIAAGVPCAIIGRPNGGKSSLYNRLCGEERAIVTDIAGTTRDILRETVSFAGVTLLLSDTAGLRDSTDRVEAIGVERALDCADSSSLVFFVYDLSDSLSDEEKIFARDFVKDHPSCLTVAVLNKNDLPRMMSAEDEEFVRALHRKTVGISARSGEGMDGLERAVEELFDSGEADISDRAMIWNAQQKAALDRSSEALACAIGALRSGELPDAACSSAEEALGEILSIDGRGVSEEIVSGIFARFCVGK